MEATQAVPLRQEILKTHDSWVGGGADVHVGKASGDMLRIGKSLIHMGDRQSVDGQIHAGVRTYRIYSTYRIKASDVDNSFVKR